MRRHLLHVQQQQQLKRLLLVLVLLQVHLKGRELQQLAQQPQQQQGTLSPLHQRSKPVSQQKQMQQQKQHQRIDLPLKSNGCCLRGDSLS